MALIQVQVRRKSVVAQDIASFELIRTDGATLPSFTAGAHIDVHTPAGIIRQYSLINHEKSSDFYQIAVLLDPNSRGGSRSMHADVQEGQTLFISEPRNHFPLRSAERTVLIAGGIGITPLLCMAYQLASIGANFALHYCTRSLNRTAFREDIASASWSKQVFLHLDDGPAEQRLNLATAIGTSSVGTQIYICGPSGFIDWVMKAADAQGFPREHIHVEHFSAAPQATPQNRAFTVRIASTGQDIVVSPDQTVVEALGIHGIDVITSCEQGVCGTCTTRVLEGICDHRDLLLSEEEKARHDQFMPCCSRATSDRLILDL